MLCSSADDTKNSAAVNAVTTSPIYQKLEKQLDDEEKEAFRAGYDGNISAMELLSLNLLLIYSEGAALGGHKEIVLQCIKKGSDPNSGLYGAAIGGHTEIEKLLREKGADSSDGIDGAAEEACAPVLRCEEEEISPSLP